MIGGTRPGRLHRQEAHYVFSLFSLLRRLSYIFPSCWCLLVDMHTVSLAGTPLDCRYVDPYYNKLFSRTPIESLIQTSCELRHAKAGKHLAS
ncbi:2-oxoglutarate-dependent dioxygenase gloF [Fusarium oxysporum f. sp. albedinis]|nr:2-oxoglutarate-dependent dioxygenase gloF [Fusarium oxysporum f. sp. albedinis]